MLAPHQGRTALPSFRLQPDSRVLAERPVPAARLPARRPRRMTETVPFRTARPPAAVCVPRRLIATGLCALLSACVTPPSSEPPAGAVTTEWSAPLPHGGQRSALLAWWSGFDDPLVAALVDAAQRANPTLAQAAARVTESRALAQAAGSARWPTLDANASAVRSRSALPPAGITQTASSATLDALWEIDLFGAVRQSVAAAEARADASRAQWHDARVSLAAEVAATYVGLRSCEAVLAVYEQDAASLQQTADLVGQKIRAGFDAPANGALARASAAEAANRVAAQRTECEVTLKQLVQLTAAPEPALREQLAPQRARLPQPPSFEVAAVPAAVLSQRPDLAAAERGIAAAAAEVGVAQADRYPRLSLSGSIGRASIRSGGQTFDGTTWSFGPGLLMPLFDGGRRRANVDAAQARYEGAVAAYRERALAAVREVEEALLRLDAAGRRETDAERAAQDYGEFLAAAQTQWQVGVGSLLDLEQARRAALAANAGLIQVQRERVSAWVQLYKTVGGAWQADDDTTTTR